jgi:hypothetical protein
MSDKIKLLEALFDELMGETTHLLSHFLIPPEDKFMSLSTSTLISSSSSSSSPPPSSSLNSGNNSLH